MQAGLGNNFRDENGCRKVGAYGVGIVTTPGNDQMHIVTERGLAEVFLKTAKDRIKLLIKIAHPDFRAWLKEKILTTPLISAEDFDDQRVRTALHRAPQRMRRQKSTIEPERSSLAYR